MRLSKKFAAIAIIATVAVTGTAAFAYWTSSGTGTGAGSAGSASAVTVNQTSVVTAMGPGVDPQGLSGTFTVANPSYVGQVTASVTGTSNDGCTAADFTIGQPTATNAEISTGSLWGGGSIVFTSSPTVNQNACQGVTVTIGYSSN